MTAPAVPDSAFHPAVGAWFAKHFARPTPAQVQAWPHIQAGRDVLIAAPAGSGDTLEAERAAMRKRPPHIVVTTPESLYVLLGSASGRAMLSTTRTVIVDEIHALASNKRGSHLALTLERLAALTDAPPTRIGLTATQKPIEVVARFL